MRRATILFVAVLFAAGLMTPALAQRPGPRALHKDWGPGPDGGMDMMGGCNILNCETLELTDDQKAEIKEINFTHRNKMIDLKASLEKAQLNLHHEMRADSPDKARLLAAAKEVNTIRGQMTEARINHRFALRDVLTADQLKKWQECCGKRGGRGGKGMGRGYRPGMRQGDPDPAGGRGDVERLRNGSCMKGR